LKESYKNLQLLLQKIDTTSTICRSAETSKSSEFGLVYNQDTLSIAVFFANGIAERELSNINERSGQQENVLILEKKMLVFQA
jgi:hypothetical protein